MYTPDVDLLGFWGEAPAAKRFPGHYRGLCERWMRESRCYFFYHTPQKWGVRYPPLQKVGGTRTPRKLRLWLRVFADDYYRISSYYYAVRPTVTNYCTGMDWPRKRQSSRLNMTQTVKYYVKLPNNEFTLQGRTTHFRALKNGETGFSLLSG